MKFECYGYEHGAISGFIFDYQLNASFYLTWSDPDFTLAPYSLEEFRKPAFLFFTLECEKSELTHSLLEEKFHETYPEVLL